MHRIKSELKFPDVELDERWFRKYGTVTDPERAARQWRDWLNSYRGHRDSAKFRKALELAVGVSRASVEHYLSDDRWYKLSEGTLQALDAVAEALGYPIKRDKPKAASFLLARNAPPRRGARRIALLVNLSQFTSPRFRLDAISSIIREGGRHNFSIALHELPLAEPEMSETVGQIVRNERPQGLVWFQLTPSEQALAQSAAIPSVVVHGVRRDSYPAPVIGHVFPLQDSIKQLVAMWARELLQHQTVPGVKGKKARRKVAVVHMPEEEVIGDGESLRNERIRLIIKGLKDAGFEEHEVVVEDYSASNAWQVIEECPNADGYVCLSDEIAIGVKHLLLARGEREEEAAHRILGFDDSSLAERHKVSSIGQHIHDIGSKVCELFERHFRTGEVVFQDVTFEVNLTQRTELDIHSRARQ
jgi:DNA-binding LacI/PurR family transcriptional regulator